MNHSCPKRGRTTLTLLFCLAPLSIVVACGSNQPPPDLAPDPALLAQIREIRIIPASTSVCPGSPIQASYEAVLDDGTHVPFAQTYDSKHPPRLHVNSLSFSSAEAVRQADGSWLSDKDPLLSATTGFRLSAALKAKPAIHATATVSPDYSCTPHAFSFAGAGGGEAQSGGNGPPITVRVGVGRSPFYDKLLIVGIQVGAQAPLYELYDARTISSANRLSIETRGGTGGVGIAGTRGAQGRSAPEGCPSQVGGPGDNGGSGGAGAAGGPGGDVTIMVADGDPSIAGVVAARSPGGGGGPGGAGGAGGLGGKGGQGYEPMGGTSCESARDGEVGYNGPPGRQGAEGPAGPQPHIMKVPADQLFGPAAPAELAALLSGNNPRT